MHWNPGAFQRVEAPPLITTYNANTIEQLRLMKVSYTQHHCELCRGLGVVYMCVPTAEVKVPAVEMS